MFLQTMLEIYPCEVFEYAANNKSGFLEKLEQGLKLAVHDASSDTRSIARKAFLCYRGLFPTRAGKLFLSFDPSIQRAFGELTENKNMSTPIRSTSANSNRAQTVANPKLEPKSVEKKARNSLNEVRDLSGTGGTTPENRLSALPNKLAKTTFEKLAKDIKEEPSIEILISNTADPSWNVRQNAFEILRTRVAEENCVRVVTSNKALWDQLVLAHLEHIVENNYKVVTAALLSLYVITDTYPEKISLALEKMLPKLLVCLSDSREIVSESAVKLLDLIIDIYIPEDLLALMLKYNSNELRSTTFLKFLEVLALLASSSTDFFTASANVKGYILKIVFLLKETPKGMSKNIANALEISFEKNKNASIACVNELPINDAALVKACLQENKSKFESFFRDLAKESISLKTSVQIAEVKKPQINVVKEEVKKSMSSVHSQENVKVFSNVPKEEPRQVTFVPKEEVKTAPILNKSESLKKVQKMNEEADDLHWEKNVLDHLRVCEECISESNLAETSIFTIQNILKKRKNLCMRFYLEFIRAMSKGFYLESRQILQMTEECIEEVIMSLQFHNSIPVLINNIKSQDVPAIQAFIRILTKVVMNAKDSMVMEFIRHIMNQMKESLNHGNADVRKSVVFCLVEIQAVIGDSFNEYLEELTPSHQKLVTIYINRRLAS